ncbi:Gfo/Idh/MocA family protein [Bradyrhizobium sp. WSM3983]|uniref:Gfo/Idh/MocA family protein n=1 Tax=Bradyrhizobium sp. WSM3983 TaxID=1038867 RepID=UPI0003F985C6|nr:Gfo/Idh/MocA family oxidoreductase [Bradyrhizobium sp. WSM3983]
MAIEAIRFGIIGSGYMLKAHSLALRNIEGFLWPNAPRIQMMRVVDINTRAAEEAAKRWGWREWATDPEAITRADDIDVVIIITPNGAHAEAAVDALKHGKHVLCEKPLADTVKAAERMVEAAAEAGKANVVNFGYRTWPAIELAKKLIADGEIGDIVHFQGHYFQDYARDPKMPFSWRFDRSVAGAGAFGDIGSHIMDIAVALVGPVWRISAKTRRIFARRPVTESGQIVTVDDMTCTLVEFANGAVGSVHASWAATGHKCDLGFTVIGTKGSIKFTWERSNELHFFSDKDAAEIGGFRRIVIGGIHPEAAPFWFAQGQGLGYGEAFVIILRRLIDAITTGKPSTSPNFAEALHVNRIVEAALRAAESGNWENV